MKRWILTFLLFAVTTLNVRAEYRIQSDIPEDAAYADSIIKYTHNRLEELIGQFELDSLDVYIVTSEDRFHELVGGAVPDWGAAVALPHRRRIVVKSPLILHGEKSLGELVAHEYSHIALAHQTVYQPVPRWLDEGLSMYVSAEWGWGDNISISWAVVIGTTVPLKEIEKLNRFEGNRAQLAYSQSFLAFKYFVDTYGVSGLRILLVNLKAGRSFDYAFLAATGADDDAFEREFKTFLTGRYNLLTLIFNSNLLWVILALIIVVGFIISRIKRKKRFEELDEYDKYHSTDFDYGEVEEPDEDKPWD